MIKLIIYFLLCIKPRVRYTKIPAMLGLIWSCWCVWTTLLAVVTTISKHRQQLRTTPNRTVQTQPIWRAQSLDFVGHDNNVASICMGLSLGDAQYTSPRFSLNILKSGSKHWSHYTCFWVRLQGTDFPTATAFAVVSHLMVKPFATTEEKQLKRSH